MKNRPDRKAKKLRDLEAICRRDRIPLTIQRRLILEVLASRSDHPTADQLYADVEARLPGVSRTTVYRVLDTLVRVGLASKVSHPGAAVRFDAVTEHHHHLVCIRCDRLLDLDDPALNALRLPDTGRQGFLVLDYSIYFRGVCSSCRRQADGGGKGM
jgi:Fur family peroxide stress response transcriptional regulator